MPHRFLGGCQGFVETLQERVRTSEGLRGVPVAALRASQSRPAPGAALAGSRKGRGGWAGWGPWAPGLGGPPAWAVWGGRAGGAAPQRPQGWARPLRPHPPTPAMARPRRLGRIPELQLAAFPAAVAEDEAFLPESLAPRAPCWPRSPPSSPVFFASPSPTFRRRLRLLRSFQDFGRQAWAG